jgi:hypothetical protein
MSVGGGAPFSVGAFAGALYEVPLSAAHWAAAAAARAPVAVTFDTAPRVRVEHYYAGAASVHRGALAYALQLEENFTTTHNYSWGARDFVVRQPANATTAWNSALVLDADDAAATLSFARLGPLPALPFSSTEHAGVISGLARVLNAWGYAADGSAAPPPASPVDCAAAGACGGVVGVTLTPFGSTHLRMTEMPWTSA